MTEQTAIGVIAGRLMMFSGLLLGLNGRRGIGGKAVVMRLNRIRLQDERKRGKDDQYPAAGSPP
jgi:hypothetical protein